MKCTDLLIEDHRVITRALDVLDRMATRVENGQSVEHADVEMLLRFLRVFADNYHQAKEESALFPELMRTSLANDARLRQMMFEHDQERSLVEGLTEAMHTQKGADFVHFANWLVILLRAHIKKEDDILFDIADRSLTSEQDENVTSQLNRFEIDSSLFEDFHRLEHRYSQHAA
jgi:hemerythrin-like domain-containing protein